MNLEHSDMAAGSLLAVLANTLNIPKVKEFIPPKIRHFISMINIAFDSF